MPENQFFFRKQLELPNLFGIYLLVMPKYWGKQLSPNWVKIKRRKRKKERKTEERKSVITMVSYALQMPPRVVHTSRLGQFIPVQKPVLLEDNQYSLK